MRVLVVTHMGHVPLEDSIIYALTARAYEIERNLLRLSCSQMLDRTRHREWARNLTLKVVCIESKKPTASYKYGGGTYLVRF